MGLHIGNGVSLDAADDAGDAPHRRNVRVSDVPRDYSVAPELRQRKVIQIHGRDFTLEAHRRTGRGGKQHLREFVPHGRLVPKHAPSNTTTVMQITVAGASTKTPGYPT
jgi:hypothetical protein